ncbi:MAG TPA: response regulator [Burkholderiales bacterium]|jgi:two-component system OmpR family response regulator
MEVADHILVVDDDAEIRRLLSEYLSKTGYRVTAVKDGSGMWEILEGGHVDLIVLDLMLPGDDGLLLCKTLRTKYETPVIMLTARGDEADRIVGLEIGADDYLPKPFSPRELLARIKVVLRRARSLPENLKPDEARALRFAEWRLDTVSRHLVSPTGVVTPLSGSEYRLLRIFLRHANRVLTRDQLMDLMQGRETDPFERGIDVQVSRLRRRLGDDAREQGIIKTVRNEGYVLAAEVEMEK